MNNLYVSQQEPSGFFNEAYAQEYEEPAGFISETQEKPTGFFMGNPAGTQQKPVLDSQSHKLPKSPSHGVGFSENRTTATESGESDETEKSLSAGSGPLTVELDLRPYQAEAIRGLRVGLSEGYLRQMLYGPTGMGKTALAVGLVKGARLKGKRVAFLCNRIQLVEQAFSAFRKYGIDCGVIQGQNSRREYEHVLVCSIQTVAKRGLPDVDFIIIDEAHGVAGSKDYRGIIETFAGKPVIGLSATPFAKGLGKQYDKLGGPLFERMVVASTIQELIAEGYLVDCDIYAPSEPDMTGFKQVKNKFGEMDFSDMDVGQATDKPELIGDIVSHWFKHANGTPTVVFASNIAHSKHIVEQFLAAGVKAEHIDCYDDTDERRAALKRFESGETTIISNSALLAEGWDAPFCQTLILARPTRSLIRYIQMAGRVLRPAEGKTRALILDHSGTVKNLGFPTDDLPLELDDGKPKKQSASKKKEEKLPTACAKCKFMKTSHKCPACGFAPEKQNDVHTADGELVKQERGAKKSKATQAEKQQFYSELLGYQSMKGYSDGRISNIFREKFGVWPNAMNKLACEPSVETKKYIQSRNIAYAKGMKNAA
ncbi:MAG TPA: DEAD/DEAH box helicase [Paraburkholderia sp.]